MSSTSSDQALAGAHSPTSLSQYSLWLLPIPSSSSSFTPSSNPSTSSHARVSQLLHELRTDAEWETCGGPGFEGHVTLCGGISLDEAMEGEDGLEGRLESVLRGWSQGRTTGQGQGQEEGEAVLRLQMGDAVALGTYFTSLVQSVTISDPSSSDSSDLLTLNNDLCHSLPLIHPPSPSYPYLPHLSLAYTSLPLSTRQDIATRLKQGGKSLREVEFGRVALMRLVGSVGDGGWEEVGRWDLEGRRMGVGH